MDMKKYAAAYNEINKNIVTSLSNHDISRFHKIAEKADLMLKTYAYVAGQQRQIYTELTGRETIEVVKPDDPRRMFDHENEKVFMRMYLQPDFLKHANPAGIMQTWGSPYFKRVNGRVVEGTFSHIESKEIIKKVKEIGTYGYDLLGLIQENSVKEVLDKEDVAGYLKDYYLLASQENLAVGTGILAVPSDLYEAEPHIYIKNLFKLHGAARRNRQPRALIVFPDYLWMDILTIDQDVVNGISRDGLDNGFGDKATSEVFKARTLRFDDDRYLTYDGANSGDSHFPGGTTADIARFGYDTTRPPADYGFDAAVYGTAWDGTGGGTATTPLTNCKFKRILVYAPEPYTGKMFLDDPDLRTSVRYENGFVMIKSLEDLAYLSHNVYCVTAMDVWYL